MQQMIKGFLIGRSSKGRGVVRAWSQGEETPAVQRDKRASNDWCESTWRRGASRVPFPMLG